MDKGEEGCPSSTRQQLFEWWGLYVDWSS